MNSKIDVITKKKKLLDSHLPLSVELKNNLDDWMRVELTYASNAIEGNTLTRIETAEVLERGIAAVIKGRSLKDQLEALNHAKAMEYIQILAPSYKSHQYLRVQNIFDIHRIILSGINDMWAGKYRQTEVFIKGFSLDLPLPHKVPTLMNEFMQWMEGIQEHPVEVSAEAHLKFVSIHPFVDGNGRTARLLMNLILLIHGYPMAIIRNEERTQYLESLNIAQTTGNKEQFHTIVENAVERSLDAYIHAIQGKPVLSVFTKTTDTQTLLRIGEIAKETGETIHTIRYWTKEGLLTVADFSQGGYQLYDPSMIKQVKKIRTLQTKKRLTIQEIKRIIEKGIY